jgi:FkbH-like protein
MSPPNLYWLEECSTWKESCLAARDAAEPWEQLTRLAATQLDFVQTNQLDQIVQRLFADAPPSGLASKPVRLAVLASSTVNHLLPALRVAALRRGLFLQTYVTGYDQYRQELLDPSSPLYRFEPNTVLFSLDARHMVGQLENGTNHAIEKSVSQLAELWQRASAAFSCQVLQQTLLPVFPAILGNNEHRLPSSNAWQVTALNYSLRCHADTAGVDLIAIDAAVQQHGLDAWYDRALWHRAKQEIHPVAAPMYGELAVRLIAARLGRSSKCLVLDLDNTLWGGVIGDDGLDGIVLGQGSTLGEAYVDFQRWVLDQTRRGVILAVCSKNDEANALAPFERHPEMLLKRSDIACFVANWNDKATNLRSIAKSLNIGLDALVFVDDNSFERNIVRRELPMVAVPELPEDPALYSRCLADAGYVEGFSVTKEDLERTQQYQANAQRETLLAAATDLDSYLASLKMDLWVKPFDRVNLKRIVQLINKTNQFNLTTRRYTEQEVESLIGAGDALTLHFRLTDTLGDNGIIGVIIARPNGGLKKRLIVDTWLMSCRVLGRQVENACMNVLAARAKLMETQEIIGEYIPTAKNNMVREHYPKLTFLPVEEHTDGRRLWCLPVETYSPFKTFITVRED